MSMAPITFSIKLLSFRNRRMSNHMLFGSLQNSLPLASHTMPFCTSDNRTLAVSKNIMLMWSNTSITNSDLCCRSKQSLLLQHLHYTILRQAPPSMLCNGSGGLGLGVNPQHSVWAHRSKPKLTFFKLCTGATMTSNSLCTPISPHNSSTNANNNINWLPLDRTL